MGIRCTPVRAEHALASLGRAVEAAKQGDPLRPVTVIVPTNAVGVTARRWLGSRRGVAAIEMVTPGRLAERIAGAHLAEAGRQPVSTPLIDLAVRAVLDDEPGDYGSVAQHPSTVTALRDLHRELRVAGPEAVQALTSGSRRGREAARVSAATAARLGGDWYDEADLLSLAADRISGGAPLFDRAVVFLPHPEGGLASRLLRAVGERADVDVLLDHTGIADVDHEQAAFAAALGAPLVATYDVEASDAAAGHVPDVTVVSTTDADEEARDATRRIVAAARAGIPFARMAIVWPVDRPYARLVEHHLDRADVPWNGRPGTLVVERLVPRFLLDLLQLDRRGLRRTDVFDLLADIPVLGPGGRRISVARWERLARTAGVSRDEHWGPRLANLAASLRVGDNPRERDADDAERLAEFVVGLRDDLGSPARKRTWQAWAEWCEQQVLRRLGPSILDQLDEAERLASDHASRVLDRLRHLDAISGPISRREFRDAFAAEFEVAPGRLGRLGDGVTVGSLAGTAGLDAELTIVLGASDGLLPPAPPIDPLVADADRRAAGLAGSDARARRLRRSFVAHLATSSSVVLSSPRGDLRATAERLPSRWIAEHAPDAPITTVASHRSGLVECAFPAADAEHRLRGRTAIAAASLADAAAGLAEVCATDQAATRALAMRAGRRSDQITEYDGDLTGIAIDHFPRPVSPSQIETWPACPHAYFVRYLLGIRPLDDADEQLGLSPAERGLAVHETLDRFHRSVITGELPQPGREGWSEQHTAALLVLFDEVADEFERTGRTGRPANWFLERRAVRNDLLNWFVRDGQLTAERRARVVRSEFQFGYDDEVVLPLADGRRLRVAGFADRVDELATGELVVTDHKTGSSRNYRNIDASDPTESATRFQLPVYASAALAVRGEEPADTTTRVRAEYGFFDKGNYERYGYSFDPDVWRQVFVDTQQVVDGIESGLYPNVTEPPKYEFYISCHYCQPDGLGVAERYDEWSRKRADPRLHRWFPVDDGTDTDDTDDTAIVTGGVADRAADSATGGGA